MITDEAKARAQRWILPLICVVVGKIGDKVGFSFAGTWPPMLKTLSRMP